MGGDSGEFEVSLGSAAVVRKSLEGETYRVFPILVRHGKFVYQPDDSQRIPMDLNDFSLAPGPEKIRFDAAFIAIHGTPGEDGKLQGYLDLLNVPYTTCDVTVSALTFNKYFCNDLAVQYGMNVAKTILLKKDQPLDREQIQKEIGFPCFVKPNKSGSSCGVTKVYELAGLDAAVSKSFAEDDETLIQQYIKGREMACGVFRHQGKIEVLPVTEIISKKDFFDYEAKYTSGMSDEITPADITAQEQAECARMTGYLYEKFNCKGVVRFDYFLDSGKWWFLEVNTVPGFSEGSIVPKQAQAAGYSLDRFFGMLLEEIL